MTPGTAAQSEVRTAWEVEGAGGDVVFLRPAGGRAPRPAGWRDLLLDSLRATHRTVAVGAKRIGPDGAIFSMGEQIIHPKGFHHVGRGVDAESYRFPEEVDAVCGGVLAVDGRAFEEAAAPGGQPAGDMALLELCVELRRAGGRIITTPRVTVEDDFAPRPGEPARRRFRDRFGFDCLAADLEEVRRRHAGTGLLWNPRLVEPPLPFEKYDRRRRLHWDAYRDVETYRQRADHLADLVQRFTPDGAVLDLGCGDGLFSHLFARRGLDVRGLDPEPAAVAQAIEATAGGTYPAARPAFMEGTGESLPWPDGSIRTVAMFDVIEHLANPVGVLRECERVLAGGGHLLLTTPEWQYGVWTDPTYHVCEYTMDELIGQLHAATALRVTTTGRIGGTYRDLIVGAARPA